MKQFYSPITGIRLFPLMLLVLLFSVSCKGPAPDTSRFEGVLREFPVVRDEWQQMAENASFVLEIHGKNASVKLTDKRTGKQWLSNPEESDPRATGINNDNLRSQLRVTYYNANSIRKTMDSFGHSVNRGQFAIRKTPKGAAVTYTLGQVDHIRLIPGAVRRDRFEMFFAKMTDERFRSQVERQYELISFEKALTEESRKNLLDKYPKLAEYEFYIFRELQNRAVLDRVEQGFRQAGYTIDDLIADQRENDIKGADPNLELFTITVHYDLEGDSFKVRIPTEEILYHPTFPITQMRLLEFFGAARENVHNGYMLVPDGSGALIRLDNGKLWTDMYNTRVYDMDYTVPAKEAGMRQSAVTLPVFGMKHDDNAYLAVIEGGDAHAGIFADIAGRINSYNYVGPEFSILNHSPVTLESLQGLKYVNTYQKRPFNGEIRLAYYFLNGDDANYSGMARKYASLLFGTKNALQKTDTPDVAIDFTMTIDKKKQFIGIPYNGEEVLTRYSDIERFMGDLKSRGIGKRLFTLTGWTRGGVNHDPAIKRSSKPGSKEEMQRIISLAESQGDDLYFDASVTRALKNRSGDGFNRTFHTSKMLDRKDAILYPYDIATGTPDKQKPPQYLLSPVRAWHLFENAFRAVEKNGLPGFALRYAGGALHSEYYEKNETVRQNVIPYITKLMEGLESREARVLVRTGNRYVLDNASFVANIELSSSSYFITDESVPFFQIVLSGNRPYSGKFINLEDFERSSFLRHVETGAVPHFSLIAKDNSLVVHTNHVSLFSVNYDFWIDTLEEWVTELGEVRKHTAGSRIANHYYLSDKAVVTEYQNGVKVVVNYGSDSLVYEDVLVSGEDYAIVR